MRLISWNVNGLRAVMNKGFMEFFNQIEADVFCVQETKMQPEQMELSLPGYLSYWNSAEKKGYSGTAVFTRREPLQVFYDIGDDSHKGEGRAITLEYEDFYLVNVYTPNAQRDLQRLPYRLLWEKAFLRYLLTLKGKKPVVVCGDMNVAHKEIDLKNPKTNRNNAGFTAEERACMTRLLDAGFVDTFRALYPDAAGAYTWWSYMYHARANNAGWRIDYFLTSEDMRDRVEDSLIFSQIMGSDHCPVGLILK